MAVNKKEKRRKQTWRVECVDGSVGMRACGWACSCVGMRMRMAVNKKEKRKKHLLIGSERADGRAEADDCKERKRKDSLVFRAGGWACGCVADGRGWMCLQADVNGCKQKKEKRRKKREKERTHRGWWA